MKRSVRSLSSLITLLQEVGGSPSVPSPNLHDFNPAPLRPLEPDGAAKWFASLPKGASDFEALIKQS